MRRFVMAVVVMLAAPAAFAADPLMVRLTLYQRMPQFRDGVDVPDPAIPDTVVATPKDGWPVKYDDLRDALSRRKKGKLNVLVAEVIPAKPLQPEPPPAFFVPELGKAVEIRPNGDKAEILLAGKNFTVPVASHETTVFGASDEMLYLAVSFLPPSETPDDTIVITNGVRPLRLVSRTEPKLPDLPEWRNRSGSMYAQLRVGPDGSVGDVQVLQHFEPKIEEAIVASMKQWRFEPAVRDGRPVTAYMIMSMPFHFD
jgi:hypothetical protein